MALLISILFFAALTSVIVLFGYRRYSRPGRVFEQVGDSVVAVPSGFSTTKGVQFTTHDEETGTIIRVLRYVGEQIPVSPSDVGGMRREMIAAGYRSESAIAVLYGVKVLSTIGFILLAILLRDYLPASNTLRNVFTIGMGILGYMGPTMVIERLVDRRQERIRHGLPDALDLLVVAVEAGLGLDQALQYVSRELIIAHKDVSEELGLVTLEIRAGKRRAEALRNLADRAGESELKKLVAVLIQTDKFGTSIADSLRTHSDFMRVRRRQDAEERAGKVGVKLVFPIFAFILPSMLLVSAGPGILQMLKYLFPLMKGFGH
jgi:tight adherence protein C